MLLPTDVERKIFEHAKSITPPMRIVCGWCQTVIQAGPLAPVSHGMCKSCKKKFDDELDRRMAK